MTMVILTNTTSSNIFVVPGVRNTLLRPGDSKSFESAVCQIASLEQPIKLGLIQVSVPAPEILPSVVKAPTPIPTPIQASVPAPIPAPVPVSAVTPILKTPVPVVTPPPAAKPIQQSNMQKKKK